jgi:hypothetical protein
MEEEREESLRELLDRLESLSAPGPGDGLRIEVESIRNDLRFLAAQITGAPISTKRLRRKIQVQKECPQCGHPVQYRQRVRPGSMKSLDCTECGAMLYSEEVNGEFVLQVRRPSTEQIKCPACASQCTIDLDPVPGSSLEVACPSCTAVIRVVRAARAIRVKIVGEPPAAAEARAALATIYFGA